MTDPREPVFAAVRQVCPGNPFNDQANVLALHGLLDRFGAPAAAAGPGHNRPPPVDQLTPRIVLELADHEGLVREAYKDSRGIWTWGIGVTDASGHSVGRYRDNPATIQRVLEIYVWLLRERYLPDVLRAFQGHPLAEHELGAALSFHYNTGAIGRADWVADVKAGRMDQARASILNWRSPPEILPRRKAERDLFFTGRWSSDGLVPVYGVAKPSYQPRGAQLVDIRADLEAVLGSGR